MIEEVYLHDKEDVLYWIGDKNDKLKQKVLSGELNDDDDLIWCYENGWKEPLESEIGLMLGRVTKYPILNIKPENMDFFETVMRSIHNKELQASIDSAIANSFVRESNFLRNKSHVISKFNK